LSFWIRNIFIDTFFSIISKKLFFLRCFLYVKFFDAAFVYNIFDHFLQVLSAFFIFTLHLLLQIAIFLPIIWKSP